MAISTERRRALIDRIERRLAIACGQSRRIELQMLLRVAREINDNVTYGLPGWRELRDKYLKFKDQYTGQLIIAPYIWIDLGRRESNGEITNSTEHQKLIAESLKEVNGLIAPDKVEDSEWWSGTAARSQSIRAVPVGGAQEVDIASRYYKALPKPKTWDEQRARHSLRGRHYLRGGNSGRARPSGDMIIVNQLVLKLNRRQRVVYRGMVLTEPPLSRAELARKLGIRHLNQISQILKRAEARMAKWLSAVEQKTK